MAEDLTSKRKRQRKAHDGDGVLRLSPEAQCLDERSVFLIARRTDQHVQRTVRAGASESVRTLCPVHFFGGTQLADIITGSLYEDGRCWTGDLHIVGDGDKRAGRARAKASWLGKTWTNERRRKEAA